DYIAMQRSFSFMTGDSSSAIIQSKVTPGGRTFEARIPWTIIQSGNYPKAGDSISITMAGIWKNGLRAYGMGSISSFRGMGDWGQAHFLAEAPKTVYVSLQQSSAANAAVVVKAKTTVNVPEKGLLSAGVYRPDGTLLRTLTAGQSTDGGKVELGWDGNDDDGKAAPAGKYEVRGLLNAGLHAKYVTSATSPGKPPYDSENPLGGWGGVWDNIQDIASDATGIYPLWGVEEGDGLLIHADEDGNVIWRQHCPLAQPGKQISVASNGKYVYIMGDKTGLWRVYCKDGKYAPIAHDGSDPLGFQLTGFTAAASLAADGNTVYVSVPSENKIACFDAETLKPTGTLAVAKPFGICLDGINGLLVVSENKIVSLNIKTGEVKPIVTSKLSSPFDVAVDKKGMIVVTDRGNAQQIKFFYRNGKLKNSFGKLGGRDNNGKFYVNQLRKPAGITVAASGKIFYSEDAAPKNFVRLSANLKYEKLWCGPWYISGEVCVDPKKPEDLYIWGGEAIIRHILDYKNKTSRPDAAWSTFAMEKYGRWFPRIVNHDGKKYLFCGGTPCSLFRIDGYKMTLVSSIAGDWQNKTKPMWIFNDLNENGKFDEGEKVDFPATTDPLSTYKGSYWAGSIDEKDLTVYLNNNQSVIKLKPTFSKSGLPIYSFNTNVSYFPLAAAQKPGKNAGFSNICHSPDGGIFGNADANGSDPRGIGHSSHLSDVYVYRLDKDGKLLWRAGKKASGIAKNGEFYGRACGLGGPIDGKYFDFVDENGQDKVYSFDGLFAGNLLDDSATALPSENTLRVEHFNSIVYQNAEDKKWYFVAGAGGYASIWEIAGMDKITRLTSEIEVK
ncbi:MAG: FlgD immunoglobulin-like domain containing protein, partial [bacterium]